MINVPGPAALAPRTVAHIGYHKTKRWYHKWRVTYYFVTIHHPWWDVLSDEKPLAAAGD